MQQNICLKNEKKIVLPSLLGTRLFLCKREVKRYWIVLNNLFIIFIPHSDPSLTVPHWITEWRAKMPCLIKPVGQPIKMQHRNTNKLCISEIIILRLVPCTITGCNV